MKKPIIIVLICVSLLALGGGSIVFLQKYKKTTTSSPVSIISPTLIPEEFVTWTDPAGFSFQYQKGIDINKHDEDQENYAHIELTHKRYPGGSIIVWAKDTSVKDADSWVKKDKVYSGGTFFETTLGGLVGKKILLATPKKRIISGVVDDGVVFYIEGEIAESDYWSRVYESVASSFIFTSVAPQDSTSQPSSEDVAVDEEEVVE